MIDDPNGRARAALGLLIALAACSAHAQPAARGYLGVHARGNANVLDEINAVEGITVTRTVENSPAAAAGIEEGDIILAVNGRSLTDPNQLLDLAETSPVGSVLHLRIERDNRVIEVEVRTVALLAESESETGAEPETFVESQRLGFEFRSPEPARNGRLGLTPRQGIEIVRLAARSPLAEAGLAPGAIVSRVQGDPIDSPDGFLDSLAALRDAEAVRLRVHREGEDARDLTVPFYNPGRVLSRFHVPLVFKYERAPGRSSVSVLFGLFGRKRIDRSAKYRALWFLTWETGDADVLEMEIGSDG